MSAPVPGEPRRKAHDLLLQSRHTEPSGSTEARCRLVCGARKETSSSSCPRCGRTDEAQVSTGAEPSAEAIEAVARRNMPVASDAWWLRKVKGAAERDLRVAYRIDAPAIHAAGRRAAMDELREARFDASVARGELDMAVAAAHAAGRDEALREVVMWLRSEPATTRRAFVMHSMADTIEAAFPTTGDTDV
jgi:hypothetical protein